jgi:biopolymer transport protein ExbB
MTRLYELFLKGGPVMYPLLVLSVFTLSCALDRVWFWLRLLRQEDQVAQRILKTAAVDFKEAKAIAQRSDNLPLGRFLLAPLLLNRPSPETFRLALEAAGDKEFIKMRQGEKFLETVVAVAPLLGLLGTVTGLITTFNNLNIGGGGSAAEASQAAVGIGEALITTAAGMIVAIAALLVLRIMVSLQTQQMDYFAAVGSELELLYRQVWELPGEMRSHLPPTPSSEELSTPTPNRT